MVSNTIDAQLMKKAFLAGAKSLESKKEWINELNVFPVPDGDTGTNMTLTMMAAAKEVALIEEPTMSKIAKAMSSGSLRGARGNSGVILSQLFRGFAKEIETVSEVSIETLANAFTRATETAYKAVMKPKEGTILTVARGMAEKALELAQLECDMTQFCTEVVEYGEYVLNQTPEMLPVLKEAGVVDSGGQGLMQVIKGALDCLMGKEFDFSLEVSSEEKLLTGAKTIETTDIKFGYCTEFIVNVEKQYGQKEELSFKTFLESIGDSIVVVSDDGVVKVHVHTNDPGLAIQKGLSFGSLSNMKIDNMREEHEERLLKEIQQMEASKKAETPRKGYGFIAVSIGKGMGEILQGIGADYLIEGGQTMNPSTEDMLKAIDEVHADTIYIFPNNKNIILAAEQAKNLSEDKEIIVVPTKTVPQGIAAMINFIPDLSTEKNLEIMTEEMRKVKTGQITYAVRNTMIDQIEIAEGDIMGIGDEGILAVGKELIETTLKTLTAMVDQNTELISIYYGEDISLQDAEILLQEVERLCPDCEIELHDGGQPIYYYLISIE